MRSLEEYSLSWDNGGRWINIIVVTTGEAVDVWVFLEKNRSMPYADNRILECALTGKADFIISGDHGDHHLLDLGEYEDIKIVGPKGFLRRL